MLLEDLIENTKITNDEVITKITEFLEDNTLYQIYLNYGDGFDTISVQTSFKKLLVIYSPTEIISTKTLDILRSQDTIGDVNEQAASKDKLISASNISMDDLPGFDEEITVTSDQDYVQEINLDLIGVINPINNYNENFQKDLIQYTDEIKKLIKDNWNEFKDGISNNKTIQNKYRIFLGDIKNKFNLLYELLDSNGAIDIQIKKDDLDKINKTYLENEDILSEIFKNKNTSNLDSLITDITSIDNVISIITGILLDAIKADQISGENPETISNILDILQEFIDFLELNYLQKSNARIQTSLEMAIHEYLKEDIHLAIEGRYQIPTHSAEWPEIESNSNVLIKLPFLLDILEDSLNNTDLRNFNTSQKIDTVYIPGKLYEKAETDIETDPDLIHIKIIS